MCATARLTLPYPTTSQELRTRSRASAAFCASRCAASDARQRATSSVAAAAAAASSADAAAARAAASARWPSSAACSAARRVAAASRRRRSAWHVSQSSQSVRTLALTRYCLLLLGDVAIVEVSPGICRAHRTGQTAAEWVGAPHPAGLPPRTERRGCAPTRPHPPASASAAAAHCACMPPCPCQRTYQQEPQAQRCAAVSGAGWDRGCAHRRLPRQPCAHTLTQPGHVALLRARCGACRMFVAVHASTR